MACGDPPLQPSAEDYAKTPSAFPFGFILLNRGIPRTNRGCDMARRIIRSVLGLYLLFAAVGRLVEGMGAVRCGCATDCWCKRPVLSTFRWVFPWGDHLRSGS